MAESSLNQIVLDAVSQANRSTQTTSNPQGAAQSLLPQSTSDFSSALTQAARQIAGLTASNQQLVDVINGNTAGGFAELIGAGKQWQQHGEHGGEHCGGDLRQWTRADSAGVFHCGPVRRRHRSRRRR